MTFEKNDKVILKTIREVERDCHEMAHPLGITRSILKSHQKVIEEFKKAEPFTVLLPGPTVTSVLATKTVLDVMTKRIKKIEISTDNFYLLKSKLGSSVSSNFKENKMGCKPDGSCCGECGDDCCKNPQAPTKDFSVGMKVRNISTKEEGEITEVRWDWIKVRLEDKSEPMFLGKDLEVIKEDGKER